jgi:hypothetical protein
MPRGAFVAVLSCAALLSVEQAYAECRTALPPAAERGGYWQYRLVGGKRCWYGPLKAGARAQAQPATPARVVAEPKPVRVVAKPKPVRVAAKPKPVRVAAKSKSARATTGFERMTKPSVLAPTPVLPVAPLDGDDEIWPKPDANFDQRFDAVRDVR